VGIGAQKLDTIESHPARLREDAQQPDMIAAIPVAAQPDWWGSRQSGWWAPRA
jgi:hypothetical protein